MEDNPIPGPGEGKRGEAGYLGYLLRQAALAYRHRQERALAGLGITPPQFSVLTMVAAYPGCSNADLARLALLTPQTVGVITGNLLRAGHVRRARQDSGRRLLLDLTESGRAALASCRARIMAMEEELASGLKPAELQDLRRWLVGVAQVQD